MEVKWPHVDRVLLEKMRLTVSAYFSERNFHFCHNEAEFQAEIIDELARVVRLSLHTSVLSGSHVETVSVHEQWPADWWQALKERWFPRWALRHWPVQYKRLDLDRRIPVRICPHMDIKTNAPHVAWLIDRDGPNTVERYGG